MRPVSTIAVGLLLLAGCQGGEQINKAASAPSPSANPAAGQPDPGTEMSCLMKCRSKAEDKNARCAADKSAEACSDELTQDLLQCQDKCLPPP